MRFEVLFAIKTRMERISIEKMACFFVCSGGSQRGHTKMVQTYPEEGLWICRMLRMELQAGGIPDAR